MLGRGLEVIQNPSEITLEGDFINMGGELVNVDLIATIRCRYNHYEGKRNFFGFRKGIETVPSISFRPRTGFGFSFEFETDVIRDICFRKLLLLLRERKGLHANTPPKFQKDRFNK